MTESNLIISLSMVCFFTLTPLLTFGSEDEDLQFLPPENISNENSKEAKEAAVEDFKIISSKKFKFTLDNTFQLISLKKQSDRAFNLQEKGNSNWNNLTRLNVRGNTYTLEDVGFNTDISINIYARENKNFNSSSDLRLDIKEAYFSWKKSKTTFLDVGRINIKNGVATGFNPTDYFKLGTVLDRNTEDVSQLQNGRLGALLIRSQQLWHKGSATLIISAKNSIKVNDWSSDKDIIGLNLNKSNNHSRILLKLTHEISDGFSPELSYYNESKKNNFGLNLSKVINKKWFAYTEWSIGERRTLIDEALQELRVSGKLIPSIDQSFGSEQAERYFNQAAIGASYSSDLNITIKIEYHYSEAALSSKEREKLFELARDQSNNPTALGQLLGISALAQTRGEPLGKSRLFLYTIWRDAIVNNFDLISLLMTDLDDSSFLVQVEGVYAVSDKSEISLRVARFQGNKDSIFGSLDQDHTASLIFKYNF